MRCSIGVAQWGEPLSADELLDRADRALLLAKRTGKERVAVAGADLEQELELVEARAGSPEAIMREFWEMVAASESSRDTLLNLPAFVRRAIGAEEVALYELRRRRRDSRGGPSRCRPDDAGPRLRGRARPGHRPRCASGSRSARSPAPRWPASWPRSAPRTCPRRATRPPAPTPSCRCCGPGARTA